MEKSFIFQTIFGLIFVSNGISSEFTTSDFVSLVGTYSEACKSSFGLKSYTEDVTFQESMFCSSDNFPIRQMYTVLYGFCKNSEFNNFTQTVCGKTSTELPDGETKILFYQAVSNVSYTCQEIAAKCFRKYAVSKILKQQEQYCSLMALNFTQGSIEGCLVPETGTLCSADEIIVLKEGACISSETNVDQVYSNALLNTSVKCQNKLSECIESQESSLSDDVTNGKYCDMMNRQVGAFTLSSCTGDGGHCTASEFNMLNETACGKPDVTSDTTTSTSETIKPQENVEQTTAVASSVSVGTNTSTNETSTKSTETTSSVNSPSVEQTTVMTSSVSVYTTSTNETSTKSIEPTSPVNSPKTTTSKVKCIPRRKNRKFVDKRKVVK